MKLHLFHAALGVEVNSFSPLLTDLPRFSELWLYRAGELSRESDPPLIAAPLRRAWSLERQDEISVTQGLCAGAQPGGLVARHVYESLRDELLGDLAQAAPADIVLLGLHGATVADGYDDCEGDLLARVRAQVGADTVVAALLDPHCHLTDAMLANTDLMFAYKEYPHDDIFAVAERLVDASLAMARGKIHPVTRAWDCRTIGVFNTYRQPVRDLVDRLNDEVTSNTRLLDISIAHGFPWGDVADMGARVWVTTDGDSALATRVAEKYGRAIEHIRQAAQPYLHSVEQSLAALSEATDLPLILAETADNPGGGAPGDATHLLSELLAANVSGIAAGIYWDPVAVDLCVAAGIGAHIPLRIGGGASKFSGDPLDLEVTVIGVCENLLQPFGGGFWPSGPAACVSDGSATIVLSANRVQCFATEAFTSFGVDLSKMRAIIVKSSNHFEASFGQISKNIMTVVTSGALTPDPMLLPYANVLRPIWPLDGEVEGQALSY